MAKLDQKIHNSLSTMSQLPHIVHLTNLDSNIIKKFICQPLLETYPISHLSVTITKYLMQTTYEVNRTLLWFMALEDQVQGWVAPLVWVSGKGAHHGRSAWQNKGLPHKPERGRPSNDIRTSHYSPHLKHPHHFPISPPWGPGFTWTFGGHLISKL
jgi:hypothetical protein